MKRVAVTGMGVVSPIGVGVERFFDGLRSGRLGIAAIRSFEASTFDACIAGEVSEEINIVPWADPSTVAAMKRDRKALFALAAAQECFESAFGRKNPSEHFNPRRIGSYIATGLEILHMEDLFPFVRGDGLDGAAIYSELCRTHPLSFIQTPSHLAADNIADKFEAKGLRAVNVSACAAGTQAIGEAFHAIQDGALDAVVTGGYDSMVNPLGLGGFCMLEALSTSNHLEGRASRPFDAARDGFVIGEGAAILMLEEYEAARTRGATIHAEVMGYGSSLDAYRVSDPDPLQTGAVAAMEKALKRAGLTPGDIDYINAHGTGTPKNDPMEAGAIRRVFGDHADRTPVSSTKSQMGHLIGAAGAVEFLAGIFALKEKLIPATVTLEKPDPECRLNHVAGTPVEANVKYFLSNSFGFGGQNAVIVAGSESEDASKNRRERF